MENVYVYLPDTKTVQAFVHDLAKLDGDFELVSDGFILDARSLMGIFSLDLEKPLKLNIEGDAEQAKKVLAEFIVDGPGTDGEEEGQDGQG